MVFSQSYAGTGKGYSIPVGMTNQHIFAIAANPPKFESLGSETV